MAHTYLRVAKWDHYQHYKNRRPPWIKFYTELLDPFNKLNSLPVPTRYLFDRLLLLAAEYQNAIPNDSELIATWLRMESEDVREGIEQLRKGRWIQETSSKRRASNPASNLRTKNSPRVRDRDREQPTPPTPPQPDQVANLIELTAARLGGN